MSSCTQKKQIIKSTTVEKIIPTTLKKRIIETPKKQESIALYKNAYIYYDLV